MDETGLKRVLPHSVEAEQSVIGSMILDPDAILAASQIIQGQDFYNQQYGILFDAMVELFNESKPVDLVTLQERLRQKGVPEEISNMEYVADLISRVPTSINVNSYAQIVHDHALSRQIIKTCEQIVNSCYTGGEPVEELLDKAEQSIFELAQRGHLTEAETIDRVMMRVLNKISAAAMAKGKVTGVPSGFADLDYKTSGFQKSDLILVAARPSMGKTAFVLNIAQYIAVRRHLPVVLFSLEMSREQLGNRLLAMESRVDSQKMRIGDLKGQEWMSLNEGAKTLADTRIIIDDTPGISISELRSKSRKYKLEHKDLSLIIIDYLQLMSASRRSDSRQQEISEISRSLKALARELDVPVIALSQLSRAVEKRDDKRPMLSDLRESGAIEQDADVVMFIYRDDYYNRESENTNTAEIIIAKQRNGPVGTVELAWLPQYTKFVNMAKQNWPKGQGE